MNYTFEVVDVNTATPHIIEVSKTWRDDHILATKLNMVYDPDMEFLHSQVVKDNSVIILMKDNNKVIGIYAAFILPYRLNKNIKSAEEFMWCIHKDYQKTRAALYLIQYINKVLPVMGIKLWNLNVPCEDRYTRLGPSLEKLGYVRTETVYIKRG